MRRLQPRSCAVPLLGSVLLGCAIIFSPLCPPALAEQEKAGHTGKVFCPVIYHIPFEYAGTIEEVLVSPGDKVREGQILARYRLGDETLLNIMTYLELWRVVLNTQIEIVQNDRETEDVKEEYDAARRLSAARMGSTERLNRLENTLALLHRKKGLLTQRLVFDQNVLQARKEVVRRKLGKDVASLEIPEYGELRSPLDGEVVLVNPALRKGMILEAFSPAITVAQTHPMEIRTRVYESDVPELRIGGKAVVTIPSLGNFTCDGVITYIDRSSEDMTVGRPSYYGVRVEIGNEAGRLRAGFQATVNFETDAKHP
ncbi:MAG: efflux RND transporter periplasmic adaptor subunit [Desulfovibrio sp.]|jgi:multidrug efflux pump subunit AcrA (membrane-fusion protein)|nr:efflux RND transporter periplasmic adaptor subunit [Desulfovibrio sp.]